MKESGYRNFSVRDLCVWFGAISKDSANLTDEFGNLSRIGLKRWYEEGYDDPQT